jgi:2'-5' RNA ligase
MAKERLKSPRARLFIALDLPDAIRSGIEVWGRSELSDPVLRPVKAGALHITLAFLGYRPEKEVGQLAALLGSLKGFAPSIRLHDPVPRPSRGRPRLFALPAESPGTSALQADLQQKLVTERLYEPETRPFWPHVTVARVRREERGSKRPAPVSRPPGALPKALLQSALCVRVALYRSELMPQGAQYTPLAQVDLPKRRASVR